MNVVFSPQAREFIQKKLTPREKTRFKNKFIALKQAQVSLTKLKPPLSHYHKFRIGNYRVLVQKKENHYYVATIDHRSKVYNRR